MGRCRGERADDAVEPGCACAERDQGEHVEATVDDGVPASGQQGPADPEEHRRGEDELEPVGVGQAQAVAHVERDDRKRETEAHPETPSHVDEFGIGLGFGGDRDWFEGHAADGQLPGPIWRTSGCIGQV